MHLCTKKCAVENIVGVRRPDMIPSESQESAKRGKSYLWVPAPHTFTAMAQQAKDWSREASQFMLIPRASDASWWRLIQGTQHILHLDAKTQLFIETPTFSCPHNSINPITLPTIALAPWMVVAFHAGGTWRQHESSKSINERSRRSKGAKGKGRGGEGEKP